MLSKLERRLLLKIDAGSCHALDARGLTTRQALLACKLAGRTYLRLMPATRRFPERWVLSNNGIHALGTFRFAS